MAEPLTIPGDPGGLIGLASQLAGAASDVQDVHDRVATNGLEGAWSGHAADAFRSTLHSVPGELDTIVAAFNEAASAVRGFAGELEELQANARWHNQQLASEEGELERARATAAARQAEVASAARAHASATDPVTLSNASRALAASEGMLRAATSDVEGLGSAISRLAGTGSQIEEEYNAAVRRTAGAIEAARASAGRFIDSNTGHSHGLFGKIGHFIGGAGRLAEHVGRDAEHGAEWAGKEVVHAGEGVVHWGERTAHDLTALDEHPSWGTLRAVLVDAKGPLEVAGVVLAIAAVVVTGGAAAAPMIAALSADVAFANVADDALIEEGDGIEAIGGNKEYEGDLIDDTTDLVTDSISLHGAVGGVDDAEENFSLAEKAEAEDGKYLDTGNSAFEGWATRYRDQMTNRTFGQRATSFVGDEVKDHAIEHTADAVKDEVKDGFSKPTVSHTVTELVGAPS